MLNWLYSENAAKYSYFGIKYFKEIAQKTIDLSDKKIWPVKTGPNKIN